MLIGNAAADLSAIMMADKQADNNSAARRVDLKNKRNPVLADYKTKPNKART